MTMTNAAAPAAMVGAEGMSLGAGSLEIRDTAINIEEIMSRIRHSIEEKKKSRVYRHDAFLSQGIDFLQPGESGKNSADHLALLRWMARMDLEGEPIASHRPLAGFAIKWFKRVTRFWVRKYTDGILSRQNHFNAEMINILSEMNKRIEQLEAENDQLRKRG
jgi:hypothetical protein